MGDAITPPRRVSVDADALRIVLLALVGPAHRVRELQMTRHLPGPKNPIDLLIIDFNAAAVEQPPSPP